MPFISATDRSLYYAAVDGAETLAADLLPTGSTVVSWCDLPHAADENVFLGLVAGQAGDYNPLPDAGEWVEAGDIYGYAGGLVIVRQSHMRTEHAPETVPALFSVYREDAEEALAWVANERVEIGMRRTYNGVLYECLIAHVTQVDWSPAATLGVLWKEVVEESECPEWKQPTGAHDAYNIGDCVTFNGNLYVSRINANVWSPATYPAGWELVGPA